MWNIEQDEEREDCDEVFNGEPFVRAASETVPTLE